MHCETVFILCRRSVSRRATEALADAAGYRITAILRVLKHESRLSLIPKGN